MVLDLLCLAVLGFVAFRVGAEGAWGSVVVFLSVLFAGLFAMNAFEPLAELLARKVSASETWQARWDVVSFLGLFLGMVFLLRFLTERLAPSTMPLPWLFETLLRWLAGVSTGAVTVAVLLTAFHLAPFPRLVTKDNIQEPLGFQAERDACFGLAPARHWLGFNQWLSEKALNRGTSGRLFDGPIYHWAGETSRWPSLTLRYADRREKLTRARMGLPE